MNLRWTLCIFAMISLDCLGAEDQIPIPMQIPTSPSASAEAPVSVGSASQLDAIVVEGSKEKKTYEESTESISVIKPATLVGDTKSTSIEVLNGFANVQVNKNGDNFSIRGINNTGVTGYQKDNLSSLIVDDVFQTDLAATAGGFNLWDMERIEIFRGAQSTSQGVNSLAGNILLYHVLPQPQNEGVFKLGYGSFNHQELAALSNNKLSERLFSRVSYNRETDDGYITNTTTDNHKWGFKKNDNVNLKLGYKLSETDELRLTTSYLRNDQGGTYVQGQDPFQYEVTEDVDAHILTQSTQVGVAYLSKLNENFSNKLTLAYTVSRQVSFTDADGTATNQAGTRNEAHKDRYYSFENLLNYQSGPWKNLLGVHVHDFYQADNYDFNLLYPVSSTFTPVAVLQNFDKFTTVYSIFNSGSYKFTEHSTVGLGLRYEMVRSKYGTEVYGQRLANLGSTNNARIDAYLNQVSGVYDDTNVNSILLPKLEYIYEWSQHYLGFALTRGYRTGGLSINRSRATAVPYDPEYTDNYEISYKRKQEDYDLGLNAFFIDWKQQQVLVKLSQTDFYDSQVVNASRAQVYGAEFQGNYKPTTSSLWGLSAGYVKTAFKDFTNSGVDYAGKEFPFASNWTGRLAYSKWLSDAFSVGTTLRYLSRSYSDAENNRPISEQFYLDLGSQYQWHEWVIHFFVKNALDKKYLIYDGRPTVASSYQVIYNQTNTPRELGLRATYFW